jgi:hypothetical protein
VWTELSRFKIVPVVMTFGFINGGKFLDELSDCHPL